MRLGVFPRLFWDELAVAVLFAVSGYIVGKLVYFIFEKIFMRFAKKTETELDDNLVEALKSPFAAFIMLLGLYVGLKNMTALVRFDVWIKGVFFVVAAIIVMVGAKRALNAVLDWYGKEISHKTKSSFDDTLSPILKKVVNIFIYVIVFIMILDHFDIQISPLIASLGVASLAIALALQDTLSNFFSGFYMMADRPIKIGDFIQLEGSGDEGYVEHIGWRSTRIRKLSNNIVVMPNSTIANSTLTNYDAPQKQLSVVVTCGVAYEENLNIVERTAYKVACDTVKNVEGAVKDFDPLVRFFNFGDSNIDFKVIVRAEDVTFRYPLTHALIKGLHSEFSRKGIEINYPARNVYFKTPMKK